MKMEDFCSFLVFLLSSLFQPVVPNLFQMMQKKVVAIVSSCLSVLFYSPLLVYPPQPNRHFATCVSFYAAHFNLFLFCCTLYVSKYFYVPWWMCCPDCLHSLNPQELHLMKRKRDCAAQNRSVLVKQPFLQQFPTVRGRQRCISFDGQLSPNLRNDGNPEKCPPLASSCIYSVPPLPSVEMKYSRRTRTKSRCAFSTQKSCFSSNWPQTNESTSGPPHFRFLFACWLAF